MTTGAVIEIVLGLALAVLGAWALPRFWSDDGVHRGRSDPPPSWPWGRALWRAQVRTHPSGAVILILAGPALVLLRLDASPVRDVVLGVVGVLFLGALLCAVTTFLLARPRWAVAPPLRDQPGLVAEWVLGRKAPRTLEQRREDRWEAMLRSRGMDPDEE